MLMSPISFMEAKHSDIFYSEQDSYMVIQHNLQALNANRQGGMVTSSRAKSAEKLSSGYKINRAADDAAGLSISEKMRKQIRGLGRAVNNGKDGISFVQIADGALNEVHDMLQRGNVLAVQAANGTNSESDRLAINNEIVQLKKEIDSVTARTKFNETMVFVKGGVLPDRVTKVPEKVLTPLEELAEKIIEEYYPNAIEQIMKGFASIGNKLEELSSSGTDQFDTKLNVDYIDGPGNTLAQMGAKFTIPAQGFASKSLYMNVDSDDYPSLNLSSYDLQMLESTIAHETMHAVMDVVFPSRMYREGGAEDFPKWFVEGTAQLAGGGFPTGWNWELANIAAGLSGENDDSLDSEVAGYLQKYTVDDRVYGHGYLAAAYDSYLAADGTDVTIGNLQNGASKLFQEFIDSDSAGRNDSFSDVILAATGLTEDQLKNEINSGSTTPQIAGKISAVEFVRKLSYNSAGGAGSLITEKLSTGGTSILADTADKDMQPFKITSKSVKYVEVTEEADDEEVARGHFYTVDLHVGSEADMTNKVSIKRYDMSTKALLLEDTNVLTEERATSAINDFGDAIIMVSAVRSYFGAIQNRLEHTLLNLDNVTENTTASESRLRDTDMADEMVRLSAFNILQQAGQSMLAQANQSTQGVMSLLQG